MWHGRVDEKRREDKANTMMTIEERTEKKLLEKTNWYKVDSKRKPENEESKIEYNPTPPIKRMRR